MKTFAYLNEVAKTRGAGFIVLLDPDRQDPETALKCAVDAEAAGADALFLGGSLLMRDCVRQTVRDIKGKVRIPVILFPGDASQLCPEADAVLFMSLVSGRNPDYLIGNQVKGAPLVREYGLEAIPTAYILIDSGNVTSVQFMSNTRPIPRDKTDIIKAHALGAEYLGLKLVYLEAGSGAPEPVPDEVISGVREYTSLPVIAGGGIRDPRTAARKVESGASFIVVGTAIEERPDPALLSEFAAAIHSA